MKKLTLRCGVTPEPSDKEIWLMRVNDHDAVQEWAGVVILESTDDAVMAIEKFENVLCSLKQQITGS